MAAERGWAYVGLEATVSEHLYDLGIFLAIFLEGELTLLVVVLVLSTTSVLSSLFVYPKSVCDAARCIVVILSAITRSSRKKRHPQERREWKWAGERWGGRGRWWEKRTPPEGAKLDGDKIFTNLSLVLRHIGDCLFLSNGMVG